MWEPRLRWRLLLQGTFSLELRLQKLGRTHDLQAAQSPSVLQQRFQHTHAEEAMVHRGVLTLNFLPLAARTAPPPTMVKFH